PRDTSSCPTRRSSDLVLRGGLANSEVLAQKQENLLARDYPLGGSTDNQVKDLLYARTAADAVKLPARLIPLLLDLFEDAIETGRDRKSTRLNSSHVKI